MMTGTYDYGLVALSYLVAVIASFTAFELSGRVALHRGRARLLWLAAGSCSMGFGIWTMHFIGMLAFSMRMPYTYDVPTTIVSLLIGIAASVVAIWATSRKSNGPASVGLSGLLLGAGIAAMHYTGMAAMRMQGTISYDPYVVAASIFVAVIAATAAITVNFTLVRNRDSGQSVFWFKATAAMIMGMAVSGMHYTGMAATRYQPAPGTMLFDEPANNTSISVWVAVAALIILGVTHLTVFFDLRISAAQRKNREAQRRALHLNELLDQSSNEIFVVDLDSMGIVNANKGACENLGYSLDELTSMTPEQLLPQSGAGRFRQRLRELYESEDQQLVYESVHLRSDGTTYPVQVHLQLSSMGDEPYLLAFSTDITATKSLESQLTRSKKLESIGRLAAGVAHEINTPAQYVGDNIRFLKDAMSEALDLIDAFSRLQLAASNDAITPELVKETGDLIRTIDPTYLAEEAPDAIEQSLDGITRISNIVRAMKEFSHPGGTTHELTDLNKSIHNTITVASNEWKYVASLETELDPDLPLIACKPQEISQVILNLIVNSAHAIESSPSRRAGTKGKISVSTRQVDGMAEIRISDTGGGIPADIQARIYDPFFTTKEIGKGTGQGLAMAQSTIVNGHHGKIRFECVEGHGTTFILSLPLEIETLNCTEAIASCA